MNTMIPEYFADNEAFKKAFNELRRISKNKWYGWTGVVGEKVVEVKAYGTWLQILRVNNVNSSGLADISVKEFNQTLDNALSN